MIEHVAITVSDIDRTVEFYTKKLGFALLCPPIDHPLYKEKKLAFVAKGKTIFEIYSLKKGRVAPSIDHVAFVVEDIEHTCEHLRKKGVRFTEKIKQSSGRKFAVLTDPDGILLQLIDSRSASLNEKYGTGKPTGEKSR
jgi:catechol 2,3-dioxygenase-like lactoylglutathione lyase family enzyme